MKFNWSENTKLGWAMPLSWPYINSQTHLSLMGVHRPDFEYLDAVGGGDIADKREKQIDRGMDLGCTEFWLLDADMIYPSTILNDLYGILNSGADMAGGLCYRGVPPFNPLIWHPTEERQLRPFEDYNFGDIVTGGATGAACLLVKRKVFETLKKPWFMIQENILNVKNEEGEEQGKSISIRRGEDTYFTRNATQAGFILKVITQYDVGHMREFPVDRYLWLTFMILNQTGSWENVIKLFKKVSNKEWFEREVVQPNLKGGREDV